MGPAFLEGIADVSCAITQVAIPKGDHTPLIVISGQTLVQQIAIALDSPIHMNTQLG